MTIYQQLLLSRRFEAHGRCKIKLHGAPPSAARAGLVCAAGIDCECGASEASLQRVYYWRETVANSSVRDASVEPTSHSSPVAHNSKKRSGIIVPFKTSRASLPHVVLRDLCVRTGRQQGASLFVERFGSRANLSAQCVLECFGQANMSRNIILQKTSPRGSFRCFSITLQARVKTNLKNSNDLSLFHGFVHGPNI